MSMDCTRKEKKEPLGAAELPASECGAVLIMVLICMSVVAVFGSLLMREVTANYYSAASAKATVASGTLLESGMLYSTDVLMRDKDGKDSRLATHLLEEWAQLPDALESYSKDFVGGSLNGRIVDESGMFPLKLLFEGNEKTRKKYEDIFLRLVNGLCRANGAPEQGSLFLKSLKNWMEPLNKGTADDDWYASREPPYQRSGRMFAYPAEFLLVRWPELQDEQKEAVLIGSDTLPGLIDLVSIWGAEKINMNTAPREIVLSIPPKEAFATAFWGQVDAHRNNPASVLSSAWYIDIAKRIGMNMSDFPSDCLGGNSSYFRIVLTADVGAGQRHLDSVVHISSGKSECLYRRAY